MISQLVYCYSLEIATRYDDEANSIHYVKKLCKEKGLKFVGFDSLHMPQNYIVRFPILDKAAADQIVNRATPQILRITKNIRDGQDLKKNNAAFSWNLMSVIVNPMFYPFI